MQRPHEYEFSGPVKKQAIARSGGKCEDCGQPGYVEIHHLLGIYYAINFYPQIEPYLVSSIANAICLCLDCHHKYDAALRKDHPYYAAKLLGMID